MAIPRKDDFLVRREKKADERAEPEGATFTYFSPVGEEDRFRFLVVREAGDRVSVQPGTDARFKVGLQAWRWKDREGGTPESWVVRKTTPTRVDLERVRT